MTLFTLFAHKKADMYPVSLPTTLDSLALSYVATLVLSFSLGTRTPVLSQYMLSTW
jgi:hypothetical protein